MLLKYDSLKDTFVPAVPDHRFFRIIIFKVHSAVFSSTGSSSSER